MGKHITERAASVVEESTKTLKSKPEKLPGPSTNPATNLIIADIVIRGAGRIVRNSLHKGVLRTRYSRDKATNIVENRSVVNTLALYGVSKLATRSLPGAVLVGSGLLVKTLFDRSQSRRAARKAGDKTMDELAEEN